MQGQVPRWWAEHWAWEVHRVQEDTNFFCREDVEGALYFYFQNVIIAIPHPLPVQVDFEALMQEVAAEEHCRGRKGGTGNKQNHLHVLKFCVTCCCFTSFEWELSEAQELSGFIFGQHITQLKDDKAAAVHTQKRMDDN